MMRLIIFCLLMTSCAANHFKHVERGHNAMSLPENDPTFDSYREEFELYAGKDTSHIPIVFEELPARNYGRCLYFSGGRRLIQINPNSWSKMDEVNREILIFHEMGHCFLDKMEHDDKVNDEGHKTSMMSTFHLGAGYYLPCREAYIKELVTGDKTELLACLKEKF